MRAGGAAGGSAGSGVARLCARAGRGRAVTRRARRIPDSRPPLRPPRTSARRLPGSSRRTVSTRDREHAAPARAAAALLSLTSPLDCEAVVFYSTKRLHSLATAAARLPLPYPHQARPSSPGNRPGVEGSQCLFDRCSLSLSAALRGCFLLWPSKYYFVLRSPHFSRLQGQKPPGKSPWGTQDPPASSRRP